MGASSCCGEDRCGVGGGHSTLADKRSVVLRAATGGDMLALKEILNDYQDSIHETDGGGCTPLHLAAGSGRVEAVKLLLEKNAAIDQVDNSGKTALWWAAKKGQGGALKILLEANADIHIASDMGQCEAPIKIASGTECSHLMREAIGIELPDAKKAIAIAQEPSRDPQAKSLDVFPAGAPSGEEGNAAARTIQSAFRNRWSKAGITRK